jgi:glucan phosphoethanolaminetransferase (alkaline phosphatase superfamily)
MRRDLFKSLALAIWLWLPTLAVLTTDQVHGFSEALALLAFSLFLLACPLLLVTRWRQYFLLLTPFALLVAPYCYLTLAYHSVPGDALLSAAVNSNLGLTIQVVKSFGWVVLLVPLSWLAYLATALSLGERPRIGGAVRKRLLAGLLMCAMLAMVARQTLSQQLRLPPFFEYSTASLAFPSGLVLSLSRIYSKHVQLESFVSVHGRSSVGSEQLLVVMVIGESLRADHLGVNGYARNTTPQLAALGKDLLSFSDVASTANWTDGAIPALVSRPVGKRQAALVQTYREAGFRTAWLSNQNGYGPGRMADVLEYGQNTQDFHFRTDANLLPIFTSFVRQAGRRQLVVLHMHGSHIPYEERYEASSKVFTPTMSDLGIDAPQPADRAATINSYDNTVIETDKFLARVIAVLRQEQRPAVLLFTSDHGENLFDDDRNLFMHTQRGPTRADIHVPLLAWMNESYQRQFPAVATALQANRARKISHAQVFPTMLDLGGVDWDGRSARDSFATPAFTESARAVQFDMRNWTDYERLK